MLYVLELCLLFIPIEAAAVLKCLTLTLSDAQLLLKKRDRRQGRSKHYPCPGRMTPVKCSYL